MPRLKINDGDDIIKYLNYLPVVSNYVKKLPYKEIVDVFYLIEKFNLNVPPDSLRRQLKREMSSNYIKINNKIYFGSEKTIKFLSDEIKKYGL